jgi:quinol monooxygenase YgiN
MLIVFVDVHVKPESIQAFREATIENARESVKEPGVARFDVLQQEADPARFMLVEVYRDEDAPAAHKETPHYAKWRDTVAPMMAEPRRGIRFTNIYPGDDGW